MSFDNDIAVSASRLQSCGIREPERAHRNLELLRRTFGREALAELLPVLLTHLSVSADPDAALNNFERFTGNLTGVSFFLSSCRSNPAILACLVTIFGASRFLSAFLFVSADRIFPVLAEPAFLTELPGKERLAERLDAAVGSDADDKTFFHALRVFRKQEMLRIGLRDLLNRADLRETVEDISDLAEVCLQKACEWAEASMRSRYGRPMTERSEGLFPAAFAVIAMGKLGGRELNFSSDVDLMYVYTADGETEGVAGHGGAVNKISNHQYFIKVAEKLNAAIGEKTEDGFVFRVDLRLRPEGQRGPLAQSLGGYEIYYESWGQTWERSALIKARPVAGDEALGREFVARITPFVFRKYLDYGAIAEIRDMKQRINKDVELKGRTHRDVKLGYGGIREIEFVIQALQLIYAGRDRSLRERSALKALHLLSQKGLISYQEHAALAKAYTFLRMVEHRIQIADDLQTQTMPTEERELRALARRTGYLEPERESELLLRDYQIHAAAVRAIYDDLFAFTGEEESREQAGGDYDLVFDPQTSEPEAVDLLRKHGFHEPEKARRNVLLLREGAAFVHQTPRSRKLFHEIFPSLFREIAASPDPDMALNHLESFLAAQGSWEAFQSLVTINASAVRVLVTIFANSEYFSRMLVSRPALLENLVESRKAYGTGTSAVFARELADVLSRERDVPGKLDALRRFKHLEEIRLGMADLVSGMSQFSVSRDFSKLAEVCVDAALRLAVSEVARRHGDAGSSCGLAVIGAGKLGGRELTYGSDLDILFVYSEKRARTPAGISTFEFFSKTAEKTLAYLSSLTREGFAFRVDTRLRPTGSKGPLVQSIDAFKSYYTGHAETWELQSLIRSRPIAGDRDVGEEFCAVIQPLVFREADRSSLAADIRNMRRRMEEEVGRKNASSYNIKQGEGGIVDIDFLVQFLQLLHGKRHSRLRVPGTHNALKAIAREGLIEPEDHRFLLKAYLFLRRLESRMRIVSNQAATGLSRDPRQLRALARRMGYQDAGVSAGELLIREYEELSRRVRGLFDRVVT